MIEINHDGRNNIAAGAGTIIDLITLQRVEIIKDKIFFYFDKSDFNAWLENENKHIPEVYNLEPVAFGVYGFNCSQLPDPFMQTSLKLSLDNGADRLHYSIKVDPLPILECDHSDFFIKEKNDALHFLITNKAQSLWSEKINCLSSYCPSNGFESCNSKINPLNLAVIGSCFSRSVFRSDDFFNPGYKRFFAVKLTFFHNSLISLMSNRSDDKEYCFIRDLMGDQVFRYVEVEFLKNIKERISLANVDYLVIDNYSDAALETIEMKENCFVTYNKYLAESIYKRKFSGKKIFTPGELKHIEKYREAVKKLYLMLQEFNLERRVILVGGRLSILKNDSEIWESKIDWVKKTNRNWDVCDSIFLEEFPDAKYIDMRHTSWISDVNSPIVGGASPSHYQSGFYKEIYEIIMSFIFKERSR